MNRRPSHLSTVLSVLLCVAVVALWVRSYSYNETVGWYVNEWNDRRVRTTVYGLSSDSGGLLIFGLHRRGDFDGADEAFVECKWINPDLSRPNYLRQTPAGYPYMGPEYAGWGSLGFGYFAGDRSPALRAAPSYASPTLSADDRHVVVPYWFLAAAVTLSTVGRIGRLRNGRRGSCPRCGYDLRATPDRCPECGTPAVATPA